MAARSYTGEGSSSTADVQQAPDGIRRVVREREDGRFWRNPAIANEDLDAGTQPSNSKCYRGVRSAKLERAGFR